MPTEKWQVCPMFLTGSFEWFVLNALPIFFLAYFRYSQQLENWPGSA